MLKQNDSFWTDGRFKTAEEHQADAFAILNGSVSVPATSDADYIRKIAEKVQEQSGDIFGVGKKAAATPVASVTKEAEGDDAACLTCDSYPCVCDDDDKKKKKNVADEDDDQEKTASATPAPVNPDPNGFMKTAAVLRFLRSTPEGIELIKRAKEIGIDAARATARQVGEGLKKA